MIKRFKNWLIGHFLPVWAKETIKKENAELSEKNKALQQIIREKEAYIEGLEYALRHNTRIYIKGEQQK